MTSDKKQFDICNLLKVFKSNSSFPVLHGLWILLNKQFFIAETAISQNLQRFIIYFWTLYYIQCNNCAKFDSDTKYLLVAQRGQIIWGGKTKEIVKISFNSYSIEEMDETTKTPGGHTFVIAWSLKKSQLKFKTVFAIESQMYIHR